MRTSTQTLASIQCRQRAIAVLPKRKSSPVVVDNQRFNARIRRLHTASGGIKLISTFSANALFMAPAMLWSGGDQALEYFSSTFCRRTIDAQHQHAHAVARPFRDRCSINTDYGISYNARATIAGSLRQSPAAFTHDSFISPGHP